MKKMIIIVMALTLILSAAGVVSAATATSALSASANVAANCSIQSVTNLDFGTYDPTAAVADDDGNGDVQFRCTKGTSYQIYVTGSRAMSNGTDNLNFELYQEVGRTTTWPSSNPGVSGTSANNSPVTKNIYGRIAALQDVGTGSYSGSVTVTVEY